MFHVVDKHGPVAVAMTLRSAEFEALRLAGAGAEWDEAAPDDRDRGYLGTARGDAGEFGIVAGGSDADEWPHCENCNCVVRDDASHEFAPFCSALCQEHAAHDSTWTLQHGPHTQPDA